MSDYATSGGGKHLALDEFNKMTPPGWEPFLSWYPLKNYFENMELWGHMISATGDTPPMAQIGPLVVARLRGAAKRLAMKISFTFPTDAPQDIPNNLAGVTVQGTQAIVFEGYAPNQATGFAGMSSGWQLIRKTFDDR